MTLTTLFESFKAKKIIVLGDIMIDAYLSGKVNRVSPEAPVPIVHHLHQETRLGGAGNVALNLLSLGASVTMCSAVGQDKEGAILLDLLKKKNISSEGIVQLKNRQTTIKTRIIGNHQQLVRIDNEQTNDISVDEETKLLQQLELSLQKGCDAIIFQDYNKGILTKNVITESIALAKKYNVITTVDPKLKNFLSYEGVTLFKPNLKELQEGLGITINLKKDKNSFYAVIKQLIDKINVEVAFITLSEDGVFIKNEQEEFHISAHQRAISDVSGAGDTVISVATLCLTAGISIKKVAEIANLAGGIVCEYRGVVAISAQQLYNEVKRLQILS